MASLVVGGVTIPVAVSSPAWSRSDAVDRGRMFDGTFFASEAGGATRDWNFSTPPVTQALADTYIATLSSPVAKLCSGDIFQLPTMCSPELPSGKPTRAASSNLVVLDFMLHEVQPAKVLLRYAPGDTITGEIFTRSTSAYQINAAGVLVSKAINVKRDGHFIGGVQSSLLEAGRTNVLLRSSDFSNAAWVKTTMTIGTGIADPAGGTTACTLTATGANAAARQTLATSTSLVRTGSVWLRRRTGTGTVNILSPDGAFFQACALSASWQRFSVTGAASIVRDSDIQIVTSGDEVDAWCYQVETGASASSEIVTVAAGVTRDPDSYSLPHTQPPGETSLYVKFIEAGTLLSAGEICAITNSTPAVPGFEIYSTGAFYRVLHSNGVSSSGSTLAAAPTIGQTVELLARLYGDGSVDITQSINGAAATVSTQSAALAFATAWSGPLLWLNSSGVANTGYMDLLAFKIVAGARSLAEMRAA